MYEGMRLTVEMVDYLRQEINPATNRPFTQKEIADMFGVTPQYVHKLKKQGAYRTKREQVILRSWPWTIRPDQQGGIYHDLRAHLEYMATRGEYMQDWKLIRLRDLYDRLDRNSWVVEYSPRIPPNKFSSSGGFSYQEREDRDEGLVIRQNEFTVLSDVDKIVWKFPPVRPRAKGV